MSNRAVALKVVVVDGAELVEAFFLRLMNVTVEEVACRWGEALRLTMVLRIVCALSGESTRKTAVPQLTSQKLGGAAMELHLQDR